MRERSPLIFWLLFAATLCVDVVVASWGFRTSLVSTEYLYFGLACAQVSIVCIGTFFATNRSGLRWLTPFAVATFIAVLSSWLAFNSLVDIYDVAMIYLALWLTQVVLVLIGLWVLQQTRFADRWAHTNPDRRWQFATRHLLAVTTGLAILLVVVRESDLLGDTVAVGWWMANNVGIALAAVMIHSLAWYAIFRLASFAAVVGLLTVATAVLTGEVDAAQGINLVQAIVIAVWIGIGQIGPNLRQVDVADNAS